jgi:Flp pilus assembly protein TadG
MIRRLRSFRQASDGAAAVEFAAVLAPLMLLMFGAFEFGRLEWTRQALQETAMAGARCMAMKATACAAGGTYSASGSQTYIEGVASQWSVPLTTPDIALNNSTTCAGVSAPNGFSSVTITYSFQSVVPHLIGALSSATALTSTACFPNY